jgi:FkbM family methyltransferase
LRGYRWIAGAATHGCWLGSYESAKQNTFQQWVGEGDVVYDIGANVGFYTLLASNLVGDSGRVVAFEPVKRNLHFLRRHLAINKVINVCVIEAAVSERPGQAKFDESSNPSMGHLTTEGQIIVPCVTLDALVEKSAIPPPNCLKIDVEGAEDEVLCGAERLISQYRPIIFLATHGEEVRTKCLGRLAKHGYVATPITGKEIPFADEFVLISGGRA